MRPRKKRADFVQLILTENVMLALAGAALGIAIATWATQAPGGRRRSDDLAETGDLDRRGPHRQTCPVDVMLVAPVVVPVPGAVLPHR